MDRIRVSDLIINEILLNNVDTAFTLTGGGAMYLNDSLAKRKDINVVCNHHEQASAMAAVAYSKYKNDYSLVVTTTGCGSTNAITGLLEAWQDNVPVIFVSGQVNLKQTSKMYGIRQLGVQEADIISIVSPITKYSVMLDNPENALYEIQKCLHIAKSGRFGPVWIDIPLDIQSAMVDLGKIKKFIPDELKVEKTNIKNFISVLEESKRPILLVGNGVRLSKSEGLLYDIIKKYKIPVVNTFLAADIVDNNNSLNIGRIGIKGNRAANFAMQNSDLLIVLGSRLSVPVTGYRYEQFARDAKIVVIDIDEVEHSKNTVKIDIFIKSDIKDFLKILLNDKHYVCPALWRNKCLEWKNKWQDKDYDFKSKELSIYSFLKEIPQFCSKESVFISDAGSAYYAVSQYMNFSNNQRYITSGAQADMGFTLPAAIGAAYASKLEKQIIAITGDGSFQTNIQEMQTITHNKLPIKIFVLNNDGYLSIRTTQKKFFNERYLGTDKNDGVSFPDLKKISEAYKIKYIKIKNKKDFFKLKEIFQSKEPVLCEVVTKKWEEIIPTIGSSKKDDGSIISRPLEDMYPFLDRKEFYDNMIIKTME